MISRQLILSEIDGLLTVLQGWRSTLRGEAPVPDSGVAFNGLPQMDYPASPEALQAALQQLSSELVVCAGKCETLADVIHNGTR